MFCVVLQISPVIMGDGLHPTPIGMLIMAECISPVVYDIIGPTPSSFSGSLVHNLATLFERSSA